MGINPYSCPYQDSVLPAWEDPANKHGGKWSVQFPRERTKERIDQMWLYTVSGAGCHGSQTVDLTVFFLSMHSSGLSCDRRNVRGRSGSRERCIGSFGAIWYDHWCDNQRSAKLVSVPDSQGFVSLSCSSIVSRRSMLSVSV